MKKIIALALCVSLIAAVFGGCSAEEKADFNGNADEYVYMYEEGRNRDWEEDIIYLAKTFLEMHPLLTDKNSTVYYKIPGNMTVESANYYDKNAKEQFIGMVNLLIPKIDEMTDDAVFKELEKLLAVLDDEYSFIYNQNGLEYFFPVLFRGLHRNDGLGVYVMAIAEEYEEFRYCELAAINGIPVEELIEKLDDFFAVSKETLYSSYSDCFSLREYLAAMGIMEYDTETAIYTFIKEDGTKEECSISVVPYSSELYYTVESVYYYNKDYSTNFWYEVFDDRTVYIRINSFHEEKYTSLGKIAKEVLAIAESDGLEKIIIDIRNNPGGSISLSGYDEFLKTLCGEDIGNIYILSDSSNTHMGILTAAVLRQYKANSKIIGSAGYSPNFFNYGGKYFLELPKHGYLFTCSDRMLISWPGYEYDVLMPDIEIYQTVEDYKNGVDTVLEAVLAME